MSKSVHHNLLGFCLEIAVWLLIVLSLAAGISGAILTSWGLRRSVYSLQCDVADLKDKVLIEVKRRAGEARQSKAKFEEEYAALMGKKQPELVAKNPWDL